MPNRIPSTVRFAGVNLGFCLGFVFSRAALAIEIECLQTSPGPLTGDQQVVVECHLLVDQNTEIRAVELDLPCSLPGGAGGTVEVANLFVDEQHSDPPFAFSGAAGGFSSVNTTFCITGGFAGFDGASVVLNGPGRYYLSTIVYDVSQCAAGTFEITLENRSEPPIVDDQSKVVGPNGLLSFAFAPTEIVVSTGTCCDGLSCLADGLNKTCCVNSFPGAWFHAGGSCDGCGCCQLHGDNTPPYCTIDVDDILFELAAFGDADPAANFPGSDLVPCGGNGAIDVDDILSVLRAFAGDFDCPHPCQP